ncbi:MAG TPA: tetratricopeptide repeat protein, partial [Terriglobales bacterium]|nr:tetratricopeptide repeat protein [Terriglobales bacterium]
GVPRDYDEAVKWYRKAAEQGDIRAARNLGYIYATGRGARLDYEEAYSWFRRAIAAGDNASKRDLAKLRQIMTVRQVQEAEFRWSAQRSLLSSSPSGMPPVEALRPPQGGRP